ncbi:hypothetical protein RND81_07G109500 [Saponaria officinalis]|uniref:Phytocyanin domain-containing protein n=1 Tax=Saponaria officinalis TaxID=3572 RepID=A0AAW1JPE7_SAPOF
MSGGRSMSTVVVVAATAVMLLQVVMAKTLTVGDATGWKIPSSPDFYSSWAAKQSFAVDDILEFKFTKSAHTVAQVTSKDAYESCDVKLDPDAKIYDSTAEVSLAKEGTYYFFCTVGSHCKNGQKLSITVPSTALPDASPSPPPPTSSPTPTGNSAPGISAFPVTFMATIVSLTVLARVIT